MISTGDGFGEGVGSGVTGAEQWGSGK